LIYEKIWLYNVSFNLLTCGITITRTKTRTKKGYILMTENILEKNPNRLIHEKIPYLLQHAFNPVDWYPWGEEVFAKAVAEDMPIFLSIGYSTCHWCHVSKIHLKKHAFKPSNTRRP
jgi:hypothetical protein